MQDWNLILSWGMTRTRLRICVELAADPALPNSHFFLMTLYQWVSYVARKTDLEFWGPEYDEWLNTTKGINDPAVKSWRRDARRIFQGLDTFEYKEWWNHLPEM